MRNTKKAKKVQFQELDTLEGKRLFNARKTLKNKGFKKFPGSKRVDKEPTLRRYFAKKGLHAATIKSISEPFTKRLVASLLVGAVCGVATMMSFGLSWIATAAVFGAASLACYEVKALRKHQIKKSKSELTQDSKQWLNQHGTGYRLGYQSKNWLPFMKSCFQTKAYTDYSAYQIGLEEAQANKAPRIRL